jgi:hypothetical protein
LEKKILKRSVEFFFDSSYSCLVLDNEMIGSKAADVETKPVSDGNTAREGPTYDCLYNTFFQLVLGICIKTVADSQLMNIGKLLDYLPTIDDNTHSMLGPLVSFNGGYGKKSILRQL